MLLPVSACFQTLCLEQKYMPRVMLYQFSYDGFEDQRNGSMGALTKHVAGNWRFQTR